MSFKNFITLIIISLGLILVSCQANKEKELQKIKDLETRLLSGDTNTIDGVSAYNLQTAYTNFYERFPEEPETPEFLFKAADMCVNLKWSKQAIDYLTIITEKYPNYAKTPDAMFMMGFVYDHLIEDDAKAGEYYRTFIEQHPNHMFVKDAEASIKNLGKSDDEIIKEFERMNADSTVAG